MRAENEEDQKAWDSGLWPNRTLWIVWYYFYQYNCHIHTTI